MTIDHNIMIYGMTLSSFSDNTLYLHSVNTCHHCSSLVEQNAKTRPELCVIRYFRLCVSIVAAIANTRTKYATNIDDLYHTMHT